MQVAGCRLQVARGTTMKVARCAWNNNVKGCTNVCVHAGNPFRPLKQHHIPYVVLHSAEAQARLMVFE